VFYPRSARLVNDKFEKYSAFWEMTDMQVERPPAGVVIAAALDRTQAESP
jgi:hypothetical protein